MSDEFHWLIHLVGPPGAGKTTLARRLSDASGYSVVESGSIVRDRLGAGDLRGLRRCLDGGMPDPRRITALVLEAVRRAMDERKADIVVEGFPRSAAQTRRWIEERPSGSRVTAIWLDASDADALVDRIMRRRVCSGCGRPASIGEPCSTAGCRGVSQPRSDADADLERHRIESQHGHLLDTLAELRRHGVDVVSIAAMQSPTLVLADALDVLTADARALRHRGIRWASWERSSTRSGRSPRSTAGG